MTIPNTDNPVDLFIAWFEEAKACGAIADATAVTLATVGADARPSARIVLLKAVNDYGFVFYTNLGSRKAIELSENPQACLCFYWMPLDKQVRIEGSVQQVSDDEADAYFASRPRESQLGAWASRQSETLESGGDLHIRLAKYTARFAFGKVPRPPFWSGYRLKPEVIEFWQKKRYRLHERARYEMKADAWIRRGLYP